jgi:hypothetical protein
LILKLISVVCSSFFFFFFIVKRLIASDGQVQVTQGTMDYPPHTDRTAESTFYFIHRLFSPALMAAPTPEEAASFEWGGTRARPRKKIEKVVKQNATYLKPPGSCNSKWTDVSVSISIECCENSTIAILDPTSQCDTASNRKVLPLECSHCCPPLPISTR